jgi:dipeptidyl aminopeptidase/acylaminoacyl peptidase
MLKRSNGLILFILLLAFALPVGARDKSLAASPFAAVIDGSLTIYPGGDVLMRVNNPANKGILSLAWSPDGSKLAYLQYDEQYVSHLFAADANGNGTPIQLETGKLEAGFPISFTPDGQILYVAQGVFPQDATTPYKVSVNRVKPEAGAQPETIGTFEHRVGCGGGSNIPADWQYWVETGFGGDFLTLTWTDFGLLHSTVCGGNALALLDLKTGVDKIVGPNVEQNGPAKLGVVRAKVSPDGKQFAAVQVQYAEPKVIRSLITVDLATLKITALATASAPDQLAWGQDGTLFYSARDEDADLAKDLKADERQRVATALGYQSVSDLKVPSYNVTIHQFNPATGDDKLVYSGSGYAIGRIEAASDGKTLFFSQIPNLNGWMKAIADGTLDVLKDEFGAQQRAAVGVQLYQLTPGSSANPDQIGIGASIQQVALRPKG